MESIVLVRRNLVQSLVRTLERVEEMREHAFVRATPRGGSHTLWTLGHVAYIESLVVHVLARGEANPLASWEPVFDGDEVSADPAGFPPFDEVLARVRAGREQTLAYVDSLSEADLDRAAAKCPAGYEDTFGTLRLCLQYVADHTLMHRGQLADARRAAGIEKMWA